MTPARAVVRIPLFLILLALARPAPAAEAVRTPHCPALSPDGDRVAFSWHGDLWTVSSRGGEAKRLAALPGYDTRPKWSPDGRTIAFDSNRHGNYDLYTIPEEGGTPTRVTFHDADDMLGDWSPDGKELYFASQRDTRSPSLYRIRLADGRVRRLTQDEIALQFPACSPDGRFLAYARGSANTWRKGYHGSANADLYLLPLIGTTRTPKRLTTYNGNDFWPVFTAGGKSIDYVTDRDGVANVWQLPLGGGRERELTHYRDGAVRWLTISADRRTLAFECDYGIWTLAASGGDPARLSIMATDETPAPKPVTRTFTGGATEFQLSPDGKRIAFAIHGKLFTIPADTGGEATQLTHCAARDSGIAWSPDSKKIAYVCERNAGQNITLLDIATGEEKPVTVGIAPESSPRFSPDGRWLAYVRGPGARWLCVQPAEGGTERVVAEGPALGSASWSPDSTWVAFTRRDLANTSDVWVAPLDGRSRPVDVTRYPGTNTQPRWTPDGKRLLFLSNRTGTMELWRADLLKPGAAAVSEGRVAIDAERIDRRAHQLTDQAQADKRAYLLSPDGKECFFPVSVMGKTELWSAPVEGGSSARLLAIDSGNVQLSADGTTLYYEAGARGDGPRPPGSPGGRSGGRGGGALYRLPRAGGEAVRIPFTARLEIDPIEERRQVFDEGWRLLRDNFYDEKMHGVDWNAVRAHYRPLVDDCLAREDFYALMSDVIGELNASHLGVGGAGAFPRGRPGSEGTARPRGMGYPGFSLDDSYDGPGLKVTKVMPDGPADGALHPGDYILAIDGAEVAATETLYEKLGGTAGESLALLVNDHPTKEGARKVSLKPVTRSAWFDLFYEKWVDDNRQRVEDLSHGRLAYLHIRAMDEPSLRRFQKELLSDAYGKEGLVLDVRWNGGGRIHDDLLALLTKKVHGYETPRGGLKMTQPFSAFTRPMILLINQSSASDAEIFPHGFRVDGLGKIVGVPTMGAVIGTRNVTLLDGVTTFRLPETAWTTPEGVEMENHPVEPDLYVENRPEDLLTGHDRQLDAAASELLKEMGGR